MKLVPEPLLRRFKVEKEKKWRSDLVNAGQGGHDARHVDTVGDGNTGSSADAASNRGVFCVRQMSILWFSSFFTCDARVRWTQIFLFDVQQLLRAIRRIIGPQPRVIHPSPRPKDRGNRSPRRQRRWLILSSCRSFLHPGGE